MIKVGTDYDALSSKGKKIRKPYSYESVEYEKDGWADPDKFLPEDGDMVLMKRIGKEPILGWVNGKTWIGFRLKPDDIVIGWKKEE